MTDVAGGSIVDVSMNAQGSVVIADPAVTGIVIGTGPECTCDFDLGAGWSSGLTVRAAQRRPERVRQLPLPQPCDGPVRLSS